MKYRHHFYVCAPLASVVEFHRRASSMAAITPPPMFVQLRRAPAVQAEGDEISFTLWLGPFPIHWLARIENVSTNSFTDRQLQGPFAEWIHKHTFTAVDEQFTEVIDEITMRQSSNLLWGLVGWGMWLGLPILFAYRAWKTRRILQ